MRGLERYIEKHGRHFTSKLAVTVTGGKWDSSRIERDAQKQVYYNVTGSTLGDMVYLMDLMYDRLYPLGEYTPNRGLKMMLSWVGDFKKTEVPFSIWLTFMTSDNVEFDFTPYI